MQEAILEGAVGLGSRENRVSEGTTSRPSQQGEGGTASTRTAATTPAMPTTSPEESPEISPQRSRPTPTPTPSPSGKQAAKRSFGRAMRKHLTDDDSDENALSNSAKGRLREADAIYSYADENNQAIPTFSQWDVNRHYQKNRFRITISIKLLERSFSLLSALFLLGKHY